MSCYIDTLYGVYCIALHYIALSLFTYNNSIRMPDDFIRTYVTVPAMFYRCMYVCMYVCMHWQAFLACFMKSDTCIPFNAIYGCGYTCWYRGMYVSKQEKNKKMARKGIQ